MARPVAIEIYGLRKTQRALKLMPKAIADLKEVHHRVGLLVLEAARARMPVGAEKHFGSFTAAGGTLKANYKAGKIKSGAKIYSNLEYAGVSEFGGTIPRHNSEARTRHKPTAKSVGLDSYYVYPAAAKERPGIIRIYEKELAKLARKYGLEGR